ncbi:MAG: hypothetical protein MI724_09290 [Spirochaetales bacterium]|nr:hypothetical protein [Spirochaetales bacterium]
MLYSIETPEDIATGLAGIEETLAEWNFSKKTRVNVLTVCSELMYNAVTHAKEGTIDVARYDGAVEIVAVDRGAGLPPVSDAFAEGWSSASSLGIGLPGVLRICDELFIETSEAGTRIRSVVRTE